MGVSLVIPLEVHAWEAGVRGSGGAPALVHFLHAVPHVIQHPTTVQAPFRVPLALGKAMNREFNTPCYEALKGH